MHARPAVGQETPKANSGEKIDESPTPPSNLEGSKVMLGLWGMSHVD